MSATNWLIISLVCGPAAVLYGVIHQMDQRPVCGQCAHAGKSPAPFRPVPRRISRGNTAPSPSSASSSPSSSASSLQNGAFGFVPVRCSPGQRVYRHERVGARQRTHGELPPFRHQPRWRSPSAAAPSPACWWLAWACSAWPVLLVPDRYGRRAAPNMMKEGLHSLMSPLIGFASAHR